MLGTVQAQRNADNAVRRHRHPLLFMFGVLGFFMFVYGGFLTQQVLDPKAFPIRKIAVDGEFHQLTTEHVQSVVSKAVLGGFFDVDVFSNRLMSGIIFWKSDFSYNSVFS